MMDTFNNDQASQDENKGESDMNGNFNMPGVPNPNPNQVPEYGNNLPMNMTPNEDAHFPSATGQKASSSSAVASPSGSASAAPSPSSSSSVESMKQVASPSAAASPSPSPSQKESKGPLSGLLGKLGGGVLGG